MARLVLVKKPNKCGDEPSLFRPICLLNGMGKFFEWVIAAILVAELVSRENLSENQGRSTVQAISKVCASCMLCPEIAGFKNFGKYFHLP